MKRLFVLFLLGLACLSAAQVNPPNVPVAPSQVALYDTTGAGSVVSVEARDSLGALIPLVDSNGVSWPQATLSIPASTAVGIGYQVTQTKPDGTHYLSKINQSSQYSITIKVISGNVTENTAGTYDSSVGSGNGIATTMVGPNAFSPTVFTVGNTYSVTKGGVTPVSALTQTSAGATFGSPPSIASLGPNYAINTKIPTDVWGSLLSGYGPWVFGTMPTPPIVPPVAAGRAYYINSCQLDTITSTSNATPIVVTLASAQVASRYLVGDQVIIQGVATATNVNATWYVSVVSGSTVTLANSVGSAAGTGGTIFANRNGMPPGSDSSGNGTFAAPWASVDKAQNGINLSQSFSAASSVTGGVQLTVTSTAGYTSGNYATVTGSSVSAYNGRWPIVVVSATTLNIIGATYSATATGTIATYQGNATCYTNTGYYQENSGSNSRFIPSSVYDNWVNFTSYTGRQDVTMANLAGSSGVFNQRSSAIAKYAFYNWTFTPTTTMQCIYCDPLAGNTINGLHFYNCIFNGAAGYPICQLGYQSSALGASFAGTATGGAGSNIVVPCTSTGAIVAGNQIIISGTSGATLSGVTGITSLNGTWTVASPIVANTSIALANSSAMTISGTIVGGTATYRGGDVAMNDIVFYGCDFNSGGINSGDIFECQPASPTAQPFSNIGFYYCYTDPRSTFQGFCEGSIQGVNGFTAIGNVFKTAYGHSFLIGIDQAGVTNSGAAPAPVTNAYVAGNYFSSGFYSANGHGMEFGEGCLNAVSEYNIVDGTIHGIVNKGNFGSIHRGNLVRMTSTAVSATHGIYAKAAFNIGYLNNVVYDNQPSGFVYYSYSDSGSSNVLDGATSLVGNLLVSDSSTAQVTYWPTATYSSGGAFSQYNVLDVRQSPATWGSVRNGTASSLATLKAAWPTYALTAQTLPVTTISGGNGSPVLLTVATTAALTTGNYIAINGSSISALNGYWQIGQLTSTTVLLVNSTAVPAASGTATLTYQFADIFINDSATQQNTAGTTGTRNDTVWIGGASNAGGWYYAEYIYQDGRRWNGQALEHYNPAAEYRYTNWMVETAVGSSGSYSRPVPFNLPSGYWTVIVKKLSGYTAQSSDPVVSQQPLVYGS